MDLSRCNSKVPLQRLPPPPPSKSATFVRACVRETFSNLSLPRVFFVPQVSHKPKLLSHAEASSIPYVANTALSALVNAGGLCKDSSANKRRVWKKKKNLPFLDSVR